jgi:putative heme transporter
MSRARVIQTVLALAVIGVIFLYFLPRVVDYGEVWAATSEMTWLELVTLALLSLWNQVTYVLVEMAARPGLGWRQALTITQTSTAVANTLPGGVALGAGLQSAMYLSYGFAPSDIAISLATAGTWNTFVKLGMPILALALLAISGEASGGFVGASVIGVLILVGAIIVFAAVLRSERGATAMGRRLKPLLNLIVRLARRPTREDWTTAFISFRRRTVDLLSERWLLLTAATLISHVTLYLILVLTLRHVGISNAEVSWQEALAAFAFVRLLSALPITPGGIGVVELGLTAALVAAGGEEAQVVAAVLIYRVLTFVLPIPIGALFYLLWRRGTR